MKKYQIQVVTSESFLLDGTLEKLPPEKALADHGVGKNDLITLVLKGELSQARTSYEMYRTLQGLGYTNIDFSGTTLMPSEGLSHEKYSNC